MSATPTIRFTLAEAAERLRCPVGRVRTLIKSGQLRALDVSAIPGSKRPRYVIDEQDLADFENRRATSAQTRPTPRSRANGAAVPNYFGGPAR